MRLIKSLLIGAFLLGSAPVADAQYYNPYGPSPVPCAYTACNVTSLASSGNVLAGGTAQIYWSARATMQSGADGVITFANNADTNSFTLSSPSATATPDMQHGAADVAGAPVAQTESYQSAAGVSNQAGANTTIDLSAGTGTGIGGNLVINGAPHSTTGTTKNAYSAALTINGDTLAATFGGNLTAFNISVCATCSSAWTGRVQETSPADGEFKITNNAGSTNLFDIGVTTTSTATIPLATTINNATFKVTTLGVATAVDTVCYASATGLFTEEPTGTTCTVSARRFKRDIRYLSSATMLSEVLAMKPVSFRFKKGVGQDDGAEVHYGLIAEDVEKAAPELVVYEKDGQTHGVKYGDGELTSHLIGAIKAEQAEIKTQQAEIDALKHEIALLDFKKHKKP